MPTEPKPVGQVSRFSLLIPGDSKDDISDEATANDSNSDGEPIQKDDWLPRETKNSKKKKKERKRSEKSDKKSVNDNSEKQQQQLPTKSMKTEKKIQYAKRIQANQPQNKQPLTQSQQIHANRKRKKWFPQK